MSVPRKLSAPRDDNKASGDAGTPTTSIDSGMKALGEYLRAMRARVAPSPELESARFGRIRKRRVRGLKREEVAMAAGISLTWYTWLEQGRQVRVSARTLRAIGRALRLGQTERAHLMRLAASAAARGPRRVTLTYDASEAVRALVTSLAPHPAYAVNGLWDVLCRNREADEMFGDFDRQPGLTDNVLRRLLLDLEWRALFVDWETVAESAVAQFRAATGRLTGHASWRRFITRLAAESAWFAERWPAQAVAPSVTYAKTVRHARDGVRPLLYSALAPDGEPTDVRVIVYVPAADSDLHRDVRDSSTGKVVLIGGTQP